MIFFHRKTIQLKFLKGNETFLLFGKLKALYLAPINQMTGMTINLRDAEISMQKATENALGFQTLEAALEYYFTSLKGLSPSFQKLEIDLGSVCTEFDGDHFYYNYRLRTWFKKDRTWVQRTLNIQSKNRLSKKWRRLMAGKRWTEVDKLAKLIKRYLPRIRKLEVQFPEWKGFEKFIY